MSISLASVNSTLVVQPESLNAIALAFKMPI